MLVPSKPYKTGDLGVWSKIPPKSLGNASRGGIYEGFRRDFASNVQIPPKSLENPSRRWDLWGILEGFCFKHPNPSKIPQKSLLERDFRGIFEGFMRDLRGFLLQKSKNPSKIPPREGFPRDVGGILLQTPKSPKNSSKIPPKSLGNPSRGGICEGFSRDFWIFEAKTLLNPS